MKKEEKEELDQQKSSSKSLKRGIVAGASGAAAVGAGYAATHLDDLMADDDESAEVIEDVDPADNEDGSFFDNVFANSDDPVGAIAHAVAGDHDNGAGGNAAHPFPAADGHGGFTAAVDEPASVIEEPEPANMPSPAYHVPEDAGNTADIEIGHSDYDSPDIVEPMPDAGVVEPEEYDPSADF